MRAAADARTRESKSESPASVRASAAPASSRPSRMQPVARRATSSLPPGDPAAMDCDDEDTLDRAPESTFERRAYGIAAPKPPCIGLPGELDRVRLIADLSRILHDSAVPKPIRAAGLLLIGWLARRMPGEAAHQLGIDTVPPRNRE